MSSGQQANRLEQVCAAMAALHNTLARHELFEAYPDLAHDYMVMQEALAAFEGDAVAIKYWRARRARLLTHNPGLGVRRSPAPPARDS